MGKVIRTDSVYWLEKIFESLGGDPAAVAVSEINKTDEPFWLEQIYKALGGKDKPQSVTDITAMTDAQLDALKVGDTVAKKTGTAEHLYTVTYKDAENGGLCLTYEDASTVETVSYDHTASGWAYNSTDVTPLAHAPETVTDITAMTDAQLDSLQVGDAVVKVTGNQKHLYLVTYKGEGEGEGIVLSYNTCGYGETVAYDRTESGWEYNSTDVKTYGD